MRLLNCDTLKFAEFLGTDIPAYYIFSHRWTDEEVSYKDSAKGRSKKSKGYAKIKALCALALRQHRRLRQPTQGCYIWIDNCCIDKRSSAELSDAINSMFRYYAGAKVCFTYLQDVDAAVGEHGLYEQLRISEWFTRGWTLQELLAPKLVVFLNRRWEVVGHKCSKHCPCISGEHFAWVGRNLNATICEATNIQSMYLSQRETIQDASIARRMSWAAKRRTTRREDEAYCLMGIFNVNMPLLYGEGDMAFQRLQEELVKRSIDHSIFAWNANSRYRDGTLLAVSSMLARSPAGFEACEDIVLTSSTASSLPYAIINVGIEFHARAQRVQLLSPLHKCSGMGYVIRLNCARTRKREPNNCVTKGDEKSTVSATIESHPVVTMVPMYLVLAEVSADGPDAPQTFVKCNIHAGTSLLDTKLQEIGDLETRVFYINSSFNNVFGAPSRPRDLFDGASDIASTYTTYHATLFET